MFDATALDSMVMLAAGAVAFALPAVALGVRLGLPAIAGPAVVGLLLSTAVLGEAWPDAQRLLIRGGYTEHREYQSRQAELQAQLDAIVGVSPAGFEGAREQMRAQLRPLRDRVDRAEARRAEQLHAATWLLIIAAMATSVASAKPRPDRHGIVDAAMPAVAMLVTSALVAVAGAALLGRRPLDPDASRWLAGLILGCAAIASPLPATLLDRVGRNATDRSLDDRPALLQAASVLLVTLVWIGLAVVAGRDPVADESAPHRPPLDYRAGGIALALLVAQTLIWRYMPDPRARANRSLARGGLCVFMAVLGVVLPILAIGVGVHLLTVAWVWFAADVLAESGKVRRARHAHHRLGAWGHPVIAGAAALLVAVQVDLSAFSVWLLLVVVIASGDGRALGMLLAVKLFGGRSWWTGMRMGAAAASAGVMSLAVAYALIDARVIDAALFAALVVGVIVNATLARPVLAIVDRTLMADEAA